MKRVDLVRSVQVQFKNLGAKNAAEITDSVFDYLKERLADGDRVELRGFGVFKPSTHMTKIGFNPRTGERVAVPASRAVKFKPSGKLVNKV